MAKQYNNKGSASLEFLLVIGILFITLWVENYIHRQLKKRHYAIEKLRNDKLEKFSRTAKIQRDEKAQ